MLKNLAIETPNHAAIWGDVRVTLSAITDMLNIGGSNARQAAGLVWNLCYNPEPIEIIGRSIGRSARSIGRSAAEATAVHPGLVGGLIDAANNCCEDTSGALSVMIQTGHLPQIVEALTLTLTLAPNCPLAPNR